MIEEQPYAADGLCLSEVETVIGAGGDDDQVAGVDFDAHPLVAIVADVEDALAVEDETHFVEGVVVLLVELGADGLEVGGGGRKRNLVLVDVAALALDALDLRLAAGDREAPVQHAH